MTGSNGQTNSTPIRTALCERREASLFGRYPTLSAYCNTSCRFPSSIRAPGVNARLTIDGDSPRALAMLYIVIFSSTTGNSSFRATGCMIVRQLYHVSRALSSANEPAYFTKMRAPFCAFYKQEAGRCVREESAISVARRMSKQGRKRRAKDFVAVTGKGMKTAKAGRYGATEGGICRTVLFDKRNKAFYNGYKPAGQAD